MFKISRIKLGLTQVKFAKLLGIPRTTYQSYEKGRRKPSKAKEKEIKRKIKEIHKRLDALDNNPVDSLIYIFDILILLAVLSIILSF